TASARRAQADCRTRLASARRPRRPTAIGKRERRDVLMDRVRRFLGARALRCGPGRACPDGERVPQRGAVSRRPRHAAAPGESWAIRRAAGNRWAGILDAREETAR